MAETFILITGPVAAGKTSLLRRLYRELHRTWRIQGFLSTCEARPLGSGTPGEEYVLSLLGRDLALPWARRKKIGCGYDFHPETRDQVTSLLTPLLGETDLLIVDELGFLELGGGGFAELVRTAGKSRGTTVIATVMENVIEELPRQLGMDKPLIIDLARTSPDEAVQAVRKVLLPRDAARIGAFSGVGGLVEVGLGSTLHAYQVPLSGHILAYLQCLLLITFGKALGGRGLVRISFISAMLKAFSPAGSRLRPMLYIFLQGLAFSLPVSLLGWNLTGVLIGSVLMSWLTLTIALLIQYLTFGGSIFEAFADLVSSAAAWLGAEGLTLVQVLGLLFALKGSVAVLVGLAGWWGNAWPLVERFRKTAGKKRMSSAAQEERPSLARSARDAAGDLLNPRFAVFFIFSILTILFFANLPGADLAAVAIRGLCISYLGFLLVRRADPQAIGRWLDKRAALGLAASLPVALGVLTGKPPAGSSDSTDKE